MSDDKRLGVGLNLSRRELLIAAGCAAVVGCGPTNSSTSPTGSASPNGFRFAERHVAGGPGDFLIARRLRLEGSNFEIGRRLATIAKERHETGLGKETAELMTARRKFFEAHWPEAVERARGVAAAYGKAWEEKETDFFGLGYDMLQNPGCSTVYYPPSSTEGDQAIVSRNYDFTTRTYAEMLGQEPPEGARAFTGDPYIVEMIPDKGYRSLYVASYDLLMGCIDGMNEKGLCVALLADDMAEGKEPTRGVRAGLNEIEVTRYLLDTCADVAAAKDALKDLETYYSFIPCHYLVADRAGNSMVFERTVPTGERHMVDGKGKSQVVTNHLLSTYGDVDKSKAEPFGGGSFNRYCALRDGIAAQEGKITLGTIKELNQAVQAGPHMMPSDAPPNPKPGRTLWHSVYNLTERTVQISFYLGEDPKEPKGQRRTDYLEFGFEA